MASELPAPPPRVLVVEDEPLICSLMVEALEDAGVGAACAATDREAFDEIRKHVTTLRVLITDVNLGVGVTGFDVARQARRLIPDFIVFYVTGHAEHDYGRHGVAGGIVVPKPYLPTQLAQRVAEALS